MRRLYQFLEVAKFINTQLARRREVNAIDPPKPVGGMFWITLDSSALPEQVVADVLTSPFDSAGQRCSALRIVVTEDIAEKLQSLTQAMPRIVNQ